MAAAAAAATNEPPPNLPASQLPPSAERPAQAERPALGNNRPAAADSPVRSDYPSWAAWLHFRSAAGASRRGRASGLMDGGQRAEARQGRASQASPLLSRRHREPADWPAQKSITGAAAGHRLAGHFRPADKSIRLPLRRGEPTIINYLASAALAAALERPQWTMVTSVAPHVFQARLQVSGGPAQAEGPRAAARRRPARR